MNSNLTSNMATITGSKQCLQDKVRTTDHIVAKAIGNRKTLLTKLVSDGQAINV